MSERLKILYLNIRSLKNILEEALLTEEEQRQNDIRILTETWIYEREIEYINIPNYQCVFKCREDNRGGGLAINLKKKLKFKELNDIRSADYTEIMILQLLTTETPINVTGI